MKTVTMTKWIAGCAFALASLHNAYAVTGCTNNLLSGSYGWQLSGTLTPKLAGGVGGAATPAKVMAHVSSETPDTVTQAVGLAALFLDGGGNLFGSATIMIDGVSSQGPLNGTYNVNDDCSASLTINDANGGSQHFDGVVVNRGDEVVLLQTDSGIGLGGRLRHARGFCQTTDISGSFGIRSAGTLLSTGPWTAIGTINLDGQGGVTATESRFANGQYSQVASAGTILINSDCTLTVSLSANTDGSLVNYYGIMLNNLKELLLIRSDDGSAVTAGITAQ